MSAREPGLTALIETTVRARQDADARTLLVRARESLDEAVAMAVERSDSLDQQRPANWPYPEPGWQAAQAAVGLPDVADAWSFEAAALEEAISNVLEAARLLDVPRRMFVWYTMGRARRALAAQRARWEGRYGVEPPDPLPPAVVAEVRNAVDSIWRVPGEVGGRP